MRRQRTQLAEGEARLAAVGADVAAARSEHEALAAYNSTAQKLLAVRDLFARILETGKRADQPSGEVLEPPQQQQQEEEEGWGGTGEPQREHQHQQAAPAAAASGHGAAAASASAAAASAGAVAGEAAAARPASRLGAQPRSLGAPFVNPKLEAEVSAFSRVDDFLYYWRAWLLDVEEALGEAEAAGLTPAAAAELDVVVERFVQVGGCGSGVGW